VKVSIDYNETHGESRPVLVIEAETDDETINLDLLSSFDNIGVQLVFDDEVHHKIVEAT
jgi:hypothetical protein